MGQVIKAVYEKGVLRPLTPLDLGEHQAVRIQVLAEEMPEDAGTRAIQILVAAGLMRPPNRDALPPSPISEEDRRELAERLSQGATEPLSEIIIKERGEW